MRILYVTICVLLADQISKLAVKGFPFPLFGVDHQGMGYGRSVSLFGDWLKFTFIENPNMAFGLEFGGKMFLTVFAVLASIGIVIYLYRHRQGSFAMRLALALILAGALGNLVDRIFYGVIYGYGPLFQGHVVDFIDFDLYTLRIGQSGFKIWPIFNIADSAVTIGVLLLFFFVRPKTAPVTTNAARPEAAHPVPLPSVTAPGDSGSSSPIGPREAV